MIGAASAEDVACSLWAADFGNMDMKTPNTKCCVAHRSVTVYAAAYNPDAPMPWPTLAPMIGITSCTTEPDFGPCTEDPAFQHSGTDDTMRLVAGYLCDEWENGCTVDSLTATGALADVAPIMHQIITREVMCSEAGRDTTSAEPTKALTPEPTPAPTPAPTAAPTPAPAAAAPEPATPTKASGKMTMTANPPPTNAQAKTAMAKVLELDESTFTKVEVTTLSRRLMLDEGRQLAAKKVQIDYEVLIPANKDPKRVTAKVAEINSGGGAADSFVSAMKDAGIEVDKSTLEAPAPTTRASIPVPTPAPTSPPAGKGTSGGEEASGAQAVMMKVWIALVPAIFAIGSIA